MFHILSSEPYILSVYHLMLTTKDDYYWYILLFIMYMFCLSYFQVYAYDKLYSFILSHDPKWSWMMVLSILCVQVVSTFTRHLNKLCLSLDLYGKFTFNLRHRVHMTTIHYTLVTMTTLEVAIHLKVVCTCLLYIHRRGLSSMPVDIKLSFNT